MILTKTQKQQRIHNVKSHLGNFNSVICITHTNFINAEIERLRDICFIAGNKVVFGKNSLVKRAVSTNENNEVSLKESTLLIFSNDVFQSLRGINDFVKSLKNYPNTKLSISCGIIDNNVVYHDLIKELSSIHSKESLYANLISMLSLPLQSLIKILNVPMIDLCKILDYQIKNC